MLINDLYFKTGKIMIDSDVTKIVDFEFITTCLRSHKNLDFGVVHEKNKKLNNQVIADNFREKLSKIISMYKCPNCLFNMMIITSKQQNEYKTEVLFSTLSLIFSKKLER